MDESSLEHDYQSQFDFQTIEEIDLNDNLVDFEKLQDESDSDESDLDESQGSLNERQHQSVDSTLIPYVGMEFPNDEITYEFYKNFALRKGFATRKYSSYKSRTDGTLIKRTFVCNKEGFRRFDKREEGREVKHRRVTRENCKAHMIVQRNPKGHWCITRFSDTHSHPMIFSPKKRARLRSNKKASQEPQNKAAIDDFHSCGIGPAKIARLINVGSHGSSKITPQQVSGHLRTSRKSNMGRECKIVLDKLMEKQAQDSQFYYAIEIDENQVCRSIFWVDGRARNAYMLFNDVVVFLE
ncbi:hypothetical protein POM88_009124 [Heracleum sosnowskyi]|uniref:FAR1 domain-containing protein n=1 Tax=Heracleum sosnowskyi TaxID=360622 RepID=A0AAD8J8T3_9APIA|nr:hypothetical protein POM88_009124 [Heracleum sosnowskyi]